MCLMKEKNAFGAIPFSEKGNPLKLGVFREWELDGVMGVFCGNSRFPAFFRSHLLRD